MSEGLLTVNQMRIRQRFRALMQGLQTGLFPPTCLLCGAPGAADLDLCPGCRAELPYNHQACNRCANPLPNTSGLSSTCGDCLRAPSTFESIFAPLLYRPPVDFLIKELKFHGRLVVARLLGELLAEALWQRSDPLPECIVPVPLHSSRLRERGFNQALELSRPLCRRLELALATKGVRRFRPTAPQSDLAASDRRANVRGAFVLGQAFPVRHAAILDDVVTTASTVTELARLLKAEGVEKVEVWACARTPI